MSRILIVIGVLPIISLYVLLSTNGSMLFSERKDMANYNMLAQSILTGKLSIGDIPSPCSGVNTDPRDPVACPAPVVDLVAHNGKYYLLQEPLPVVFYLCSLLILEKELPTGMVVILFACGSTIVLGMIIAKLHSRCLRDSPRWLILVVLSYFAFSGMQLYMVSRPVIYHETIVVGAFFMLTGTFCFVHAITDSTNERLWFGLAGAFLGAAIFSKISMIWYPICFWLLYIVFQFRTGAPFQRLVWPTVSFLAPLICFGFIFLTYNYLRFGNPLDFGRTHVNLPSIQLYNYCILQDNFIRLRHVPYNLANYFITLPEIMWRDGLPWIHFSQLTINNANVLVINEKTACLFVMTPALLLCLALPFALKSRSENRPLRFVMALCAMPSVVTFLFYLAMIRAVPRYLYEFTPLAYVLIYVALACFWPSFRTTPFGRATFILLTILICIINTAMGFYLGIDGMTQG